MKLKLIEKIGDKQIPIQSVIDVNTSINSIIKSSYRSLIGAPPRSRVPDLKITVSNFQNGSLIHDLAVSLQSLNVDPTQTAFALANFAPKDVLDVAKNAITFFKLLGDEKKKGNIVNVTIKEGSFGIVNVGNGSIEVGDIVIDTAARINKSGNLLTKPLRSGELSSIELISSPEDRLVLDPSDSDCFDAAAEIDLSVKEAIGNVFEFNKLKKTGRFTFIENQEVVSRNFVLVSESSVLDAIDSMKKNLCKLSFHEEYIELPDSKRLVIRLQVMRVQPV